MKIDVKSAMLNKHVKVRIKYFKDITMCQKIYNSPLCGRENIILTNVKKNPH